MITEEQTKAIGEVLVNHWGCHAQTGYSVGRLNVVTLWTKLGPGQPAKCHYIYPDGQVEVDDIDWDGKAP